MVKIFACGVNEYRGARGLPFCMNDVKAFCETFENNLIIDKENIVLPTIDGEISNTDYCKELKNFCMEANEEDTLVIFHSGHGGVDEDEYSYLLMTNTLNEDTRVYTDQIIDFLTKSKAKTKIVLLDCCHSDVGDNLIPSIEPSKIVEDFYASGISIFSSCKKSEKSTSENGTISVFTDCLCNALRDKHLVQNGKLYFHDFQNLVSIYAANYNRKHPDETQTPIMRTSMIGTAVFEAKNYKVNRKFNRSYSFHSDSISLLDIKPEVKSNKENSRKFIGLKVITHKDWLDNDIEEIIISVIKILEKSNIEVAGWKEALVKNHPIEIGYMIIYRDEIDYDATNSYCQATWTLHRDQNWHHNTIIESTYKGFYSYKKNTLYDYYKADRIKNTYSDDELIMFWKEHVMKVNIKTGEFDKAYHAYKAEDISLMELREQANIIYNELREEYEECDNARFPIPFSEYKEFDKISSEVVSLARGLVFISGFFKTEETEENVKSRIELELSKYYHKFEAWSVVCRNL
ncbi:MAG: caspase family protein [Anaerostipes sp.]|nr:caspase family protein [Anaerostipes sp.]